MFEKNNPTIALNISCVKEKNMSSFHLINDVLKPRKVIEFESSYVAICFFYIKDVLYIRRNNNKVDFLETERRVIAHLLP